MVERHPLRIEVRELQERIAGWYIPKDQGPIGTTIHINRNTSIHTLRATIRHELMHYILDIHGVKVWDEQEKIVTILSDYSEWLYEQSIFYYEQLKDQVRQY